MGGLAGKTKETREKLRLVSVFSKFEEPPLECKSETLPLKTVCAELSKN
jgi:hypothetical protein